MMKLRIHTLSKKCSYYDVQPSETTGLKRASQIMVDKIVALRWERIDQHIGRVNDETLIRLNRSLALFIGLAS